MRCPSGFDFVNPVGCVQLVSTQVSWSAAQSNCVSLGGWLVTYPSPYDTVALFNYVKTTKGYVWPGGVSGGPWIGLNDISSEGVYAWVQDGSVPVLPSGSLFWRSGYPQGGSDRNCVAMTGSGVSGSIKLSSWALPSALSPVICTT